MFTAEKLTTQTAKKIPVPQVPKYKKKLTPIRLTFRVWKIKIIIEMQVTTPNGWDSRRIELLLNLNPNIWSLTNKGINLIVNWFILCDVSTVVKVTKEQTICSLLCRVSWKILARVEKVLSIDWLTDYQL